MNLLWVDMFKVSSPEVPLSRERVADLAQFLFRGQWDYCRVLLDLAVTPEECSEIPGGLKMISPEEYAHAVVYSCAVRLRSHDCTAEEKEKWRTTLFLRKSYGTFCFSKNFGVVFP